MATGGFFPEKDNMLLLVVDIQDNLLKAFDERVRDRIVYKSSLLIRYFRQKGFPIVVLEQYPKGIGPTNAAIQEVLGDAYRPITKNCFSGVSADGVPEALNAAGKTDIVLIGIESHICVLQTCWGLLGTGRRVFVPADAVGSRFKLDWELGVRSMGEMGARVTSTEVLVFQWLQRAGTDEFKAMLPYLK